MKGYIKHKHECIPQYFMLKVKGAMLPPSFVCKKTGRNKFNKLRINKDATLFIFDNSDGFSESYIRYYRGYDIIPITEGDYFLEVL